MPVPRANDDSSIVPIGCAWGWYRGFDGQCYVVGGGPGIMAITDPDAGIAIITDIMGRHIVPIHITEAIRITGGPMRTIKATIIKATTREEPAS
jgi:hypothetical protein